MEKHNRNSNENSNDEHIKDSNIDNIGDSYDFLNKNTKSEINMSSNINSINTNINYDFKPKNEFNLMSNININNGIVNNPLLQK